MWEASAHGEAGAAARLVAVGNQSVFGRADGDDHLQPRAAHVAGKRRRGGRSSAIHGKPEQAQLILGLFGMVIVFGLGSIVSGLYQIVTGRRNKWLFILMVVFVVLILFSWFLRSYLRSSS